MRRGWALVLVAAGMMFAGCRGAHKHIPVEETPAPVMAGFQREFPGLTISHTDTVVKPGGQIEYQLKFRDAQNRYHRKMFDVDGKLVDNRDGVALPQPAAPMP
jgi:hypothetical protein